MKTVDMIQPYGRIIPMIYAYTTPGVSYHEGWTKIGYTEKQTVEDRIRQQTHTADIQVKLLWRDNAIYKDGSGESFTDHDFHEYLERYKGVDRQPKTEWFHIDGKKSKHYFDEFAQRNFKVDVEKGLSYVLRREQREAVEKTKAYFEKGGREFLWNAKPRFGKTLTSYDLIRTMGFRNTLVVTNRPSIANSWAEDFQKFIAWQTPLDFVSDTDALKGKKGVMTRDEFLDAMGHDEEHHQGMVAFESLQGLKGSVYFGGGIDKLKWISDLHFDLLIVDESQEGVETYKTERAFDKVHCDHILYLSGTPFKQLAKGQFSDSQIYNWSYADEQEAKENWKGDDFNPYERLPQLAMFTYQMSPMITGEIKQGASIPAEGEDFTDYAFDLNEFFLTNSSGKFIHEEEVKKFLHALSTNDKYPFSTEELREKLPHTLWLLNYVSSAKALAKLLQEDPVFKDYHVVLAAGDGKLSAEEETVKAYDKVKKAIHDYSKTITLSVGQLTVGVTIPEWCGVLMLCNMKSPSSYMQAAFRAQNPYEFIGERGERFRKETAYVFDFDPARTLTIYDEFANDLSKDTVDGHGTKDDRAKNIRRLLNFFPVIGEDSQGSMVELNAAQVLSIPRKLKSEEVVRRGFMSNFLFANIGRIFAAPQEVKDILDKLTPAKEEIHKEDHLDELTDGSVPVDENGQVDIPDEKIIGTAHDIFGPKIYDTMNEGIQDVVDSFHEMPKDEAAVADKVDHLVHTTVETVTASLITPLAGQYHIPKSKTKQITRDVTNQIEITLQKRKDDFLQNKRIAEAERDQKIREAETSENQEKVLKDFEARMKENEESFNQGIHQDIQNIVQSQPVELVRRIEETKAEEAKDSIEDTVRDHLRGFSRTIPSFLMAYGDDQLTLANLDDYTEDDVFQEVTGITEDEFRFLRDGGDYEDHETHEMKHFDGHLFDEVVFDDSIRQFMAKKKELANYFEENQSEDIFNYIPPQKTNQIFTPRRVVKKMVDLLEKENPGCFDDDTKTFADLYMKSGMYITEIVKRLYNSPRMKDLYPDKEKRLNHIFAKQVYGLAPTKIIYRICRAYILGFSDKISIKEDHIRLCDSQAYVEKGTLAMKLEELFPELAK
ncbi:DEAD/DEAH box helicase [uncultured Dialister sp.]|uniref:DEAD/DEAH box helicase n=1 Tax=uncultured Dialister sp. TaxID=278064 RepID=UPI00265DEB6F|nr:DEAD/DEAH box helicase family protein [uncultured Dialister sp.]